MIEEHSRSRLAFNTAMRYAATSAAALSFSLLALIFVYVIKEAVPLWNPAKVQLQSPTDGMSAAEPIVFNTTPLDSVLATRTLPAGTNVRGEITEAIPLGSLLGTEWDPSGSTPKAGLLPLVWGTAYIALMALLMAIPVGVMVALWTTEFAPRSLRNAFQATFSLLASFPSVVVGFLCLTTVGHLLSTMLGNQYHANGLTASIGLAFAIIPTVATLSIRAFMAVPQELREASIALGARPGQTLRWVVLPCARPGLLAAVLLAAGRGLGETMIILLASGNAPLATLNPLAPMRTVASTIALESGDVLWDSPHFHVLFLLGLGLFLCSTLISSFVEVKIRPSLARGIDG